jgi:hypothetical protein
MPDTLYGLYVENNILTTQSFVYIPKIKGKVRSRGPYIYLLATSSEPESFFT